MVYRGQGGVRAALDMRLFHIGTNVWLRPGTFLNAGPRRRSPCYIKNLDAIPASVPA